MRIRLLSNLWYCGPLPLYLLVLCCHMVIMKFYWLLVGVCVFAEEVRSITLAAHPSRPVKLRPNASTSYFIYDLYEMQ
ncbi:hypothetical protein HW555_011551 [Spodoptera exigua]|uniref:Uncharacterized protein n=1 Tax=Spodoptera exigua TaxID=7107 RepID=A0A835G8B4_SPOEX|nr:hypothetical protein HW555_011551 [Spodoptera exigua]